MPATYTHDLAIKTGEYTDPDGNTKGRWLNIGKVFRHEDGGTSIKLDAMPVGLVGWEGWVSVFKRRERDGQVNQYQGQGNGTQTPHGAAHVASGGNPNNPPAGFDDDIPF